MAAKARSQLQPGPQAAEGKCPAECAGCGEQHSGLTFDEDCQELPLGPGPEGDGEDQQRQDAQKQGHGQGNADGEHLVIPL